VCDILISIGAVINGIVQDDIVSAGASSSQGKAKKPVTITASAAHSSPVAQRNRRD
jgi:hypothetical protein